MPIGTAAVTATDVTFRYGRHTAIDRSTFEIPAAGITALIGPNGAGKSTILGGIAGLLRPASGTLHVSPIGGQPRRLAYVMQATKVNEALPITVREVVTMGRYTTAGPYRRLRSQDRTEVQQAMDRMGIADLAQRHVQDLSGGERQRMLVAQGLAQTHDVLLLDEPLTGLDLASAQAIDDIIHDEQARGCTVVMSTHDLAEARVADHVILLAGRVIATGTPDVVLTTEKLSSAYGAALLHVKGESVFIDDPAHRPATERHRHRERTIHVEGPSSDLHGRAPTG